MNAIARKAALELAPKTRMMERMNKSQLIAILVEMISIGKEQEKIIASLSAALDWERGINQQLRNLRQEK